MKITTNKLLGSLTGIQPHINWLLANLPGVIEKDRDKVKEVLQDLSLKYAKHSDVVLELCSQAESLVKKAEPVCYCGDGRACAACDLSETFCNHRQ